MILWFHNPSLCKFDTLSNRRPDDCLGGKKKVPRWQNGHRGASVDLKKIPGREHYVPGGLSVLNPSLVNFQRSSVLVKVYPQ